MNYAQLSGDGTCTATENQGGTAARLTPNFEFFPGNALLNSGAKRFCAGFLGSEARSETLRGAGSGAAICDFCGSKNTVEEPGSVALDGAGDPIHFDQIDSGSDQHDATVAQE